MKNFFIFSAILITLTSNAQVYKYKTYETCISNPNASKPVDPEWQKEDFLVVINFTKYKVNTYGGKEGDYDLISLVNDTTDGNQRRMSYTAVDGEGAKVIIFMIRPKDSIDYMLLVVSYPDADLCFKLKRD